MVLVLQGCDLGFVGIDFQSHLLNPLLHFPLRHNQLCLLVSQFGLLLLDLFLLLFHLNFAGLQSGNFSFEPDDF